MNLAQRPSEAQQGIRQYQRQVLGQWNDSVQQAAASAFTDSIASIRNYRARGKALQALGRWLRKLRGDETDSKAQQSKNPRKAKSAAA